MWNNFKNGFIKERISGQKVIKVFNHEKANIKAFDEQNEELCKAATSALGAGAAKSLGPEVGCPAAPRMEEGVRLPPGAPSTRLIITGGESSLTGGDVGQNSTSRMNAACRQRDRRYDDQFIERYFLPEAAGSVSGLSATTPSFSMPTALMRPMTSTTTP